MTSPRRLALLCVPLLMLLLTGCSVLPLTDNGPRGNTRASGDVVERSLRDVEKFWEQVYPEVSGGDAFQVVRGGYHPYTERNLPPACGGSQMEYQPNAFYCPAGDFIAWDAQTLIPQLQEQFGPVLVGVVMAHEYGHAIQFRLGRTDDPTVVLEQQADCFAGAWLSRVLAGDSDAFERISGAELDNTVAGLLLLRDQPGTSAQSDQAHGNAFDRIRALQDGVEKGAETCAGYRADNLPVTEVPFSSREEAASGGELPYGRAVELLAQDAQNYWSRTFPELTGNAWERLPVLAFDAGAPPQCAAPDATAEGAAFYCPESADGDFAAFDNTELGPNLHRQIGDNAVGMLLGDLYARAAQDRRGASTRDLQGQLAVDCLAGSWTNDLLTRSGDSEIRLSPGDLDEAVAALLAFGRAAQGGGPTAFDRIASYRTGVLEGLRSCV